MSVAPPQDRILTELLDLIKDTGYEICQRNGQRHYGPPPDWVGPAPKGCEVFVGRIPRDCFENELVPIFSTVGTIYEVRLMMDFSGYNRGFGFVRYTTPAAAAKAVEVLNQAHVRPGCPIGVTKSIDNTRLFVGGLPLDATRDEVLREFGNLVPGIVDVIMYPCPKDRRNNRGFVFLEFDCHDSAALARRALIPGPLTSFGDKLLVDWAEPEPAVDDSVMKKVKVLYVRNLNPNTSELAILDLFSKFVMRETIHRVKKINDYAFVHFHSRSDAELVLQMMQNVYLDGCRLEVKWARPADKARGKSAGKKGKYNNIPRGRMEHRRDVDKQVVGCRPQNTCDEVQVMNPSAREVLEDMCKRFNWSAPQYKYREFYTNGGCFYSGCVYLPFVSLPYHRAGYMGPFMADSRGDSPQDVKEAAAQVAINNIFACWNSAQVHYNTGSFHETDKYY